MGRFSVSGRSKKFAESAIAEELLIDKETGQFLVKTVDGENVVSLDATIIKANHQRSLSTIARLKGFTGDIYSIPVVTSLPMPCAIAVGDVLVTEPLDMTTLPVHESFIISVDAIIVNQTDQIVSNDPQITITLELLLLNGEVKTVDIVITSTESSVTTFTLTDLTEQHGQFSKLTLKGISFNEDELSKQDQLVILNDVLLFVESEE